MLTWMHAHGVLDSIFRNSTNSLFSERVSTIG
jgi:hypothetical protein